MSYRNRFVFFLAVGLALGLSFISAVLFERNQIETSATNYISIWEQEIVETLIQNQDRSMLEKIVSQLQLIRNPIDRAEISLLSDQFQIRDTYQLSTFQVPLSVNFMTVGMVEVSLNVNKLIAEALLSPAFLIALFLILSAATLTWIRSQKAAFEQQVLQQKVEQQTAIAELGRQVAHDIRGPLSALQAIAAKSDAISEKYFSFFNQSTERIQEIANDLLKNSRHLSGANENSKPKSEPVSVKKVLRVLNDEFSLKMPEINWVFPRTDFDNVAIDIPESKLSRMLANLLQNSAEAQSSTVHLQVARRSHEFIISVQDNGVGIPESVQQQLFQAEVSNGKLNGNGIALRAAKQTLERIGGDILLSSKEMQGTLVQIRIPTCYEPIQKI